MAEATNQRSGVPITLFSTALALAIAFPTSPAHAQPATGPDVIVGDITNAARFTPRGQCHRLRVRIHILQHWHC